MERVIAEMAYRGPDAACLWQDEKILLGHRRLSIIDLSEAGQQPLHDLKRGVHIVFNGEIYNYQALRKELETRGYAFVTSTDTETVLGSYTIHGKDFVDHLNGMFAFVLYDRPRNKLILCRDRIGEKPLYYYIDNQTLIAFSEIKFFHALRGIPLNLDMESVRAFFALQYIPGPHTVYREIKKVPPGHWLELDLGSWRMTSHRYWSIEKFLCPSPSDSPSIEDLDRAIAETVRLCLVSDVEMGMLLSGGIDSSLLSAYSSRLTHAPLRGFVVRFEEEHLDESPFARKVARALHMPLVELDGGKIDTDVFQRVVYHGDEPLGDPACIPTYLIHQEIAGHVKVVLSGEGADELFWGYPRYQHEMIFQRLASLLPSEMLKSSHPFLALLEDETLPGLGLSRLTKLVTTPSHFGCARWATIFGEAALSRLLAPFQPDGSEDPRYMAEFVNLFKAFKAKTTALEASLATDIIFWLPDNLLTKVDRMSMAHSVEARAPFLGHHLVEMALRMRPHMKADLKETKRILRKLLARQLSSSSARGIIHRGNHGFDVPLHRWLAQELRNMAEELFSPASIKDCPFLSTSYVLSLWNGFQTGIKSLAYARKLWLLLCFLSWHRWHKRHFDL